MTAAAAQRQADYNKKQSFPLSPPTARPPPPSPSLPVLCKTSRHRRSDSRYQTSPREPRPVPPGGPSRRPAVRPHPGSPSRLRRIPNLPATRSQAPREKALTMGPNFMPATGMGWGKPSKGWGARTPSAGIFGGGLSQQHPHPVSKSPAPSQPPPRPGTPEHPLLSRACRRWGSQAQPEPGTPPRVPFPQHCRARTGAARRRGDPGAPRQSFHPHPAVLFCRGAPPVAKPGRFYLRRHVHVPRSLLSP